MLRDALLHGRSCNIFFLPAVMKVDLFAIGPAPYDEIEFSKPASEDLASSTEIVTLA